MAWPNIACPFIRWELCMVLTRCYKYPNNLWQKKRFPTPGWGDKEPSVRALTLLDEVESNTTALLHAAAIASFATFPLYLPKQQVNPPFPPTTHTYTQMLRVGDKPLLCWLNNSIGLHIPRAVLGKLAVSSMHFPSLRLVSKTDKSKLSKIWIGVVINSPPPPLQKMSTYVQLAYGEILLDILNLDITESFKNSLFCNIFVRLTLW